MEPSKGKNVLGDLGEERRVSYIKTNLGVRDYQVYEDYNLDTLPSMPRSPKSLYQYYIVHYILSEMYLIQPTHDVSVLVSALVFR
jgi:hypothetical protein